MEGNQAAGYYFEILKRYFDLTAEERERLDELLESNGLVFKADEKGSVGFITFLKMFQLINEVVAEEPSWKKTYNIFGDGDFDTAALLPNKPDNDNLPSSSSNVDTNVGGINFNPENMFLKIESGGDLIQFEFNQKELEAIEIEGLFPVIYNIQTFPLQQLPLILGISSKNQNGQKLSLLR